MYSSLKCLKCNKSFDKLCTFQAHENICTGLDKFKCSVCGSCFTDKNRLIIIYIIVGKSSRAEGVVCYFMIGSYLQIIAKLHIQR